ncbi:MAG: hypothetical protein ACRDPK_11075 [Carbonactinosporaceae bacterium]
MKVAAVAFGVAVVFLGVVLGGAGQWQAFRERPPSSIELRQADPAVSPATRPTPRSASPMQGIDRTVGPRHLGRYDDHRSRYGGDDDNSGPGSGDDDSRHRGRGDHSGRGADGDHSDDES